MINALGLLEVRGLTASIEAADTMLKTAQVRLLNQTITPSGLITLVIEGDLAACRAALDAGSAAASRIGQVLVKKEIGRPDKDTQWLVTDFGKGRSSQKAPTKEASKQVASPQAKTVAPTASKVESVSTKKSEETDSQELIEVSKKALLDYITKHPQGRNVTDIISYFNATRAEIKAMLDDYISTGIVYRRGNRYYLVEAKK